LIPADNVEFSRVKRIAEEVSARMLSKDYLIDLRERLISGKVQVF